MTKETAIKIKEYGKKVFHSSLAALVICIGLCVIAKKAQASGELWQAFTLVVTSNIVIIVFLLGIRSYTKQVHKLLEQEKDKT